MLEINKADDRLARGLAVMEKLDRGAGQRMLDALNEVAPDLARYTVEFPFGDIYSRGTLSLRDREIATIAALVTLGFALPQLKVHLHCGLNVGCTRAELVEVIMQMAVYAGFPAALNAALAAQDVFKERDAAGIAN